MFIVAPMLISKFSFVFFMFIAFIVGIMTMRLVNRLERFRASCRKLIDRVKNNIDNMGW